MATFPPPNDGTAAPFTLGEAPHAPTNSPNQSPITGQVQQFATAATIVRKTAVGENEEAPVRDAVFVSHKAQPLPTSPRRVRHFTAVQIIHNDATSPSKGLVHAARKPPPLTTGQGVRHFSAAHIVQDTGAASRHSALAPAPPPIGAAAAKAPHIPTMNRNRTTPRRDIRPLSREDLEMHVQALYQQPPHVSVRKYVVEHNVERHRHTLSRALKASGLLQLKSNQVPWEDARVQQALAKYLQGRRTYTASKKVVTMDEEQTRPATAVETRLPVLAAATPTAAAAASPHHHHTLTDSDSSPSHKKTHNWSRITNQLLRQACLDVYRRGPQASVRKYCAETNHLQHRTSINAAFLQSGLKTLRDQGVPMNESVQIQLDAYLSQRKFKGASFEEKEEKEQRNPGIAYVPEEDLRRHCQQLYQLPLHSSLRRYCRQHKIEPQRRTLRLAFSNSGLLELQARGVPYGPQVEAALEGWLEERRKRIQLQQPKPNKEPKPPPKKIIAKHSNAALRAYCLALYKLPENTSIRGFAKVQGILPQRQTLARVYKESGLRELRDRNAPFLEAEQTLAAFLGGRKTTHKMNDQSPVVIKEMPATAVGTTKRSGLIHLDDYPALPARTAATPTRTLPNATTMGALPAAAEPRPQEKERRRYHKLSEEELRDHLYDLYKKPESTSMRSYFKSHGLESHRSTLTRMFELSGLKALKKSNVAFGQAVELAMNNFLEARRRKAQQEKAVNDRIDRMRQQQQNESPRQMIAM